MYICKTYTTAKSEIREEFATHKSILKQKRLWSITAQPFHHNSNFEFSHLSMSDLGKKRKVIRNFAPMLKRAKVMEESPPISIYLKAAPSKESKGKEAKEVLSDVDETTEGHSLPLRICEQCKWPTINCKCYATFSCVHDTPATECGFCHHQVFKIKVVPGYWSNPHNPTWHPATYVRTYVWKPEVD